MSQGFAKGNRFTGIISPTQQRFTSGSGTYTTPANVKYIRVRMVAGGGGGRGSALISSADGGAGGTGGNSTFGTSLLTCTGAGGGNNAAPGPGSAATISSPAYGSGLTGGSASSVGAQINAAGLYAGGGNGGNTIFGGGGGGGHPTLAGTAGTTNTGAGGGGAGSPSNGYGGEGGGGSGGIDAFIDNPSATFSYSVGAAGAAGSAGTGGHAGAAGGSGYIEVTEYYQAQSYANALTLPLTVANGGTSTANTGAILSGTYTPTGTNVTNVAANTPSVAQYLRVNNVVTVSGYCNVDSTTTGQTVVRLTLPIASTLGGVEDCVGVGACATSGENPALINADTVNNEAQLVNPAAVNTGNVTWYYTYTYQII